MNIASYIRKHVFPLIIFAAVLQLGEARAASTNEQSPKSGGTQEIQLKFPLVEIDSRWYTNATLVPGARDVFISHIGGLKTVKVTALSEELREQLGYPTQKSKTNTVANWTKSQVSRFHPPEFATIERAVRKSMPLHKPDGAINKPLIYALSSVAAALFILFSLCCKEICIKSGSRASLLVWIPVFQILPLLRAAKMPPLWFFAAIIPGIGLVAYAIWCFKIAAVHKKGPALAVSLLLPFTSPFAFLYLAFGEYAPQPKPAKERRSEMMTLEAA